MSVQSDDPDDMLASIATLCLQSLRSRRSACRRAGRNGRWSFPRRTAASSCRTRARSENYDEFRYAAIRRVDNTLYISGVIVGRGENEGRDAAAFKLQVDRAFSA